MKHATDGVISVDETTWFFRNVVKRRVTWAFALGGVFLLGACPTRTSVFFGFWLALAGEAVRTWASGTIVKNHELATEGPYSQVRHPLYLGNFLLGLGVAVMGSRILFVVLFLLLFVPVYRSLALKEEKRLQDRYGDEFWEYRRRVPMFVPDLSVWPPTPARFDAGRMWREHREWKAWLGLYALTLYLLLRLT